MDQEKGAWAKEKKRLEEQVKKLKRSLA